MTSMIASWQVNLALMLPLQVRELIANAKLILLQTFLPVARWPGWTIMSGLARHGDHAVAIETDGGRVVPRETGTIMV